MSVFAFFTPAITPPFAARRVIPGLNDSHLHVIRGGLNYNMELRWDGSLADGLRMLKEQVQRTPPGQWVRVVGGWTEAARAGVPMPQHQHNAACHHHGCSHAAHQLLAGVEAARNRHAGFFGLGCDCFAF